MTLALGWPDRMRSGRSWRRRLRGLASMLRLWQRGLARRRFLRRVADETRDPGVLEDLGISPSGRRDLERWVMAMLWHQH